MFLTGFLKSIPVQSIDKQTHGLKQEFKIPYINNSSLYKDESKKSIGYDIFEGKTEIAFDPDTKKLTGETEELIMCHTKLNMLKSNRLFIFLIVIIFSGLFYSYAEDLIIDDNIAFLLEGPVYFEGLPGIGENIISGYRGKYSCAGSLLDVYYTREIIPVFSDWEIVKSRGYSFYKINENQICFINSDKWAMFITFEKSDIPLYEFAVEITKKMLFFAKTEEFFKVSSFPAIITINR